MEAAGQATDQVVKVTLDGVEYILRLTGKAAVNTAAMLAAMAKTAMENRESRGAQRLATMLKSGKELTVFSIPEQRLKEFSKEAKRYGVTFCALRDKDVKDGVVDLLVRSEDASKINRIIERYSMEAVAQAETVAENPTQGRTQEARPRSDTSREPPSAPGFEKTADNERPSVRNRIETVKLEQQAAAPDAPKQRRRRTHKTPER